MTRVMATSDAYRRLKAQYDVSVARSERKTEELLTRIAELEKNHRIVVGERETLKTENLPPQRLYQETRGDLRKACRNRTDFFAESRCAVSKLWPLPVSKPWPGPKRPVLMGLPPVA
jgi:hypothetical protein